MSKWIECPVRSIIYILSFRILEAVRMNEPSVAHTFWTKTRELKATRRNSSNFYYEFRSDNRNDFVAKFFQCFRTFRYIINYNKFGANSAVIFVRMLWWTSFRLIKKISATCLAPSSSLVRPPTSLSWAVLPADEVVLYAGANTAYQGPVRWNYTDTFICATH